MNERRQDHTNQSIPLRGQFPRNSTESDSRNNNYGNAEGVQQPAAGSMQYYAVASEGEVLSRFTIRLRSGMTYSLSYALLPYFILIGNQKLIIKAPELEITVTGRNLKPVERSLSREQLLWITESPNGTDEGNSKTYIGNIIIAGSALHIEEEL